MDHTNCNQVRFEIDEKDLGAPLSVSALDHLKHCAECQEFRNKETKLRQIVGSLETVSAPADFDFRLRARLANDSSRTTFHLASPFRLLRSKSFALAAMLVIFAGAAFVLRQLNQPPINESTAKDVTKPVNKIQPAPADKTALGNAPIPIEPVALSGSDEKRTSGRPKSTQASNKRATSTLEFSNTVAPVIRGEQSMASVAIPLDVSQQSFKVLLDDGRGSSRTISVPTVSFGSRRVFTTASMANQYAPKSDW